MLVRQDRVVTLESTRVVSFVSPATYQLKCTLGIVTIADIRQDRRRESDESQGRDDSEKGYLRALCSVPEYVPLQLWCTSVVIVSPGRADDGTVLL
jgi:hypothetical protein